MTYSGPVVHFVFTDTFCAHWKEI